jgi:hypothetical protein
VARIRPWDEEHNAGDLFTEINGGTWVPLDGPTAPPSTYDIKVTLPSGRTIALEVTQDTTPAVRHQRAVAAKLDWTSDRLDAWWEVSALEASDARAIHAEVFGFIGELDAAGETKLLVRRPRNSTSSLNDRLWSLGVRLLYRVRDENPGYVNLSPASEAGSTGPSALIEIAEDHANREDNATKLANADADERHLWVWVTSDRGQQVAALVGDLMPTEAPKVPDHIETVWLATAYESPIVWSWVRHIGWERRLRSRGSSPQSQLQDPAPSPPD